MTYLSIEHFIIFFLRCINKKIFLPRFCTVLGSEKRIPLFVSMDKKEYSLPPLDSAN